MGLLKNCFILFTGTLLYSLLAHGQDNNLGAQLPNSLLECYQNESYYYYRGNRMPHTIDVFIDLIRKIESAPSLNMDMRELVVALLHRFRLDGVVFDPSVRFGDGVLPYSVKGQQMFKNQLILKYFIQGNALHFPNESLSSMEKCNLHFMVSSSIDTTQRGDESQSCQTYRYNQYRRYRRSEDAIPEMPAVPEIPTETSILLTKLTTALDQESSTNPIESTTEAINPDKVSDSISTLNATATTQAATVGTTESTTLNNNENETTSEIPVEAPVVAARALGVKSVINKETETVPVENVSEKSQSGKLTDFRARINVDNGPTSECPIENGAVLTRYGTVNIGNVLAGIAAGLNPLNVRTTELFRSIKIFDGQIDNKFAVTLSGDLAEVALIQGSVKTTLDVGSPGAWNSTYIPQWYFIDGRAASDMTDAELRGDLDGLILASKVQTWYDSSNKMLKLSSLLDMYYNGNTGVPEFPQYTACHRKELLTEVAPTDLLKSQSRLFSVILNQRLPSPGTVLENKIFEFSDNAVDTLISYIPSKLDTNMKCPTRSSYSLGKASEAIEITKIPKVNIFLVIDTNYDLDTAKNIIMGVAGTLNVNNFGSNITVVSGSDGVTLLQSSNMSGVAVQLTQMGEQYNSRERGLKLAKVLRTTVQKEITIRLDQLKKSREPLDNRTVIIVVPQSEYSLSDSEYTEVYNTIQTWKDRVPIARLLIACKCKTQTFEHLVLSPSRDIITLSEITSTFMDTEPILKRVNELTQPLINPQCGSQFSRRDPNQNVDASLDYLDVNQGRIYSIHPKYFYGIDSTIKVKALGFNYGQIRVCSFIGSSEINSVVDFNNTSDGSKNCQVVNSGINKEWTFSNPCSSSASVDECKKSIYVTVTAESTLSKCGDNACRSVWQVKYGLVATGLHCSGASNVMTSSLLLILTALAVFLKI